MPKNHAQHHNPPKPEFTSYKRHQETEMSLALRKSDEARRHNIALRRQLRILAIIDNPEHIGHQAKPRGGYPTKRFVDPERIKKRGVPGSHFTNCFKLMEQASGAFKVMILHATRGWKVFA